MLQVFAWIEMTPLSVWLRESLYGFQVVIVAHALGMGFLAGTAAVIDLRILGLARQIPQAALRRFLPVAWTALTFSIVSGLLLLIAYPTKALTNPLFYFKLALFAAGLFTLVRIRRLALVESPTPARLTAIASLVSWAGVIAAGRLLAYTYHRLMAS